jgi:hypothetical protein
MYVIFYEGPIVLNSAVTLSFHFRNQLILMVHTEIHRAMHLVQTARGLGDHKRPQIQ